jgi:hypothetical protein
MLEATIRRAPGAAEIDASDVVLRRVDLVARREKVVRLPYAVVEPLPRGGPTPLHAANALAGSFGLELDGLVGRDGPSTLRRVQRALLAYARMRTAGHDVHRIDLADALGATGGDAGSDDIAETLHRCLDTRSRHERAPHARRQTRPRPRADASVAGFEGRRLPGSEVARLCFEAGWRHREELVTAVAVAGAESNWYERAWHRNESGDSVDRGLFQINRESWPMVSDGDAFDAAKNAQYAFAIYRNAGRRFTDWVSYEAGTYEHYLPLATEAVAEFLGGEESWDRADDHDVRSLGDAVQHEIDAQREPVS